MSHERHNKRRGFYYKGMRVNSFGLPIFSDSKENCDDDNKIRRTKRFYHPSFTSPFKVNAPKDTIVTYDIPTEYATERDWFRRQLMKFGYIKIRQSIFAGPSPLPSLFVKYLKEIRIDDKITILKLARSYSGKSDIL